MDRALLALALSLPLGGSTAAAAPAPTFALVQMHEDAYFHVMRPAIDDAAAVISRGMNEDACVYASRYLNAWGSFTLCVPETPR